MSMIAQFVQVTSDALSRARREPEAIEEIFDESPAIPAVPLVISQAVQEAWKRRGPRLLAGTLGRLSPELREVMTKRIGVTLEKLQQGGGGDAVIDLMRRRGGIRMESDPPPEPPTGASASTGRGAGLSLEKNWHALHYLLSGKAELGGGLAGQAVLGGDELGEDFSGYGPARGFAPERVGEIARELSRTGLEAEMTARFDPAELTRLRIYPFGWSAADRDLLIREFHRLRQFYVDASARGLAIVTCIV